MMLGFLINSVFIVFGNQVFQLSVGIPMGTNCAPLIAGLFYITKAESIQKDLQEMKTSLLWSSNSTF
jgi:hypothetical protein